MVGCPSHARVLAGSGTWDATGHDVVKGYVSGSQDIGAKQANQDSVKNKMSKGDGMSWAEFTYPLMQAWDWWHMFINNGVSMQIGGSDQYGNITAGIDAVKYISKSHPDSDILRQSSRMPQPLGFTAPLMTTASGAKFGKSAGNAVWLDSKLTSVFDLYGYFLKTSDADVGNHLKMLTFLPEEQIEHLLKQQSDNASLRVAQHALAQAVVALVHGDVAAKSAEQQHRLLFGNQPPLGEEKLPVDVQLPRSLLQNKSLGHILQAAGLAETASEGQRSVKSGGIYLGRISGDASGSIVWNTLNVWESHKLSDYITQEDRLLLRKGKQNVKVVQIIPDQALDD